LGQDFFDLRVPAVFIEPIYRDHMEKNYHLLAAGQSGSSIHQADAHSALFFHLGVFYPLTFSKISLKCLARFDDVGLLHENDGLSDTSLPFASLGGFTIYSILLSRRSWHSVGWW